MCEEDASVEVRFLFHEEVTTRKSFRIARNASVSKIKSLICSDGDIRFEECEILFCGHAMRDSEHLDDFNIGPQTVLHVITRPDVKDEKLDMRGQRNFDLNKTSYLTGIWLHRRNAYFPMLALHGLHHSMQQSLVSKHPQFYIYCKTNCLNVFPGKLRVRCAACSEGSIVLRRDPQDWNDVLCVGRILGNCYSEQCNKSISGVEFYFKCTSCDQTAVPLQNVVTNLQEIECSTCIDIRDPVVCFPCSSEHVMCLSCFEEYARSNLRERRMVLHTGIGYSIACPQGCEGSFVTDAHLFYILGIDEYSTYQAFAAEECLIRGMKGMVCPNPQCGTGLFPDLALDFEEKTQITCSSCAFKFCSTCREAYHGSSECGVQYLTRPGNSAAVRDYLASIKTVEEISKKCPNCKTPTERSGGCMHMTCKMCNYEWCWNCVTAWNYECQANHWFT